MNKSEKTIHAIVLPRRGTYKDWVTKNPVIREGELIIVTELPWYLSWFGLKPTALKCGFGLPFTDTNFI
jgi:hypothetical protein